MHPLHMNQTHLHVDVYEPRSWYILTAATHTCGVAAILQRMVPYDLNSGLGFPKALEL